MPAHSHRTGGFPNYSRFCWRNGGCDPFLDEGSHENQTTTKSCNEIHNNMPLYFVLAYIMRL